MGSQAFSAMSAKAMISARGELDSSPFGRSWGFAGSGPRHLGGEPGAERSDLADMRAALGTGEVIGVAGGEPDLEGRDQAAAGERSREQPAAADRHAEPLFRRLVRGEVVVEARATLGIDPPRPGGGQPEPPIVDIGHDVDEREAGEIGGGGESAPSRGGGGGGGPEERRPE